jgi:GT2 family glycosyltransferase
MKFSSVSVVIPTYNKRKELIAAIESILQQSYQIAEVIVVDNASTDDTLVYLKKLAAKHKQMKIVKNSENTGVTGGRNRGIEHATGQYVLFFDHDMVADKKMVGKLVVCLEEEKSAGIITPKIFFWDKKDTIWSAGTDVNLFTGQTIFYGGKDIGQFEKVREVAVAPAVLLVKREVIKKIKGFDPVFFATYEDTDFCFRAKKAGFLTYYTPKAVAYHKIPYDTYWSNQKLLERLYWVGRNRIIFMKRYGKNFFIFLLFLPVFLCYYILLCIKYRNMHSLSLYIKGTMNGFINK